VVRLEQTKNEKSSVSVSPCASESTGKGNSDSVVDGRIDLCAVLRLFVWWRLLLLTPRAREIRCQRGSLFFSLFSSVTLQPAHSTRAAPSTRSTTTAMKISIIAIFALLAVLLACSLHATEARLREGECEGQCDQTNSQRHALLHCTALHRCTHVTATNAHSLFSNLPLSMLLSACLRCRSSAAVCLKRMGEFSTSLAALKEEEAIHNGIRKLCKSYTDKADKRFVRRHANKRGEVMESSGTAQCECWLVRRAMTRQRSSRGGRTGAAPARVVSGVGMG